TTTIALSSLPWGPVQAGTQIPRSQCRRTGCQCARRPAARSLVLRKAAAAATRRDASLRMRRLLVPSIRNSLSLFLSFFSFFFLFFFSPCAGSHTYTLYLALCAKLLHPLWSSMVSSE